MKSKKALIIIISIIAVLAIVAGGFLFIFTKTDLFKTEEQLFGKYFERATAGAAQFENTKELDYIKKITNTLQGEKFRLIQIFLKIIHNC